MAEPVIPLDDQNERVLLVVPPSETKAPWPEDGPPVDLDGLSFPELTPLRRQVARALIATSESPDAFRRLFVRPTLVHDVAMNSHVLELPTRPVHEVYTGPLQQGLDLGGLHPAAAERGSRDVVFVSPLWGVLRPQDRIPRYRLHVSPISSGWATSSRRGAHVPRVLAEAAGADGLVVDLRSPTYQAMGLPAGGRVRVVTLRVDLGRKGERIGDVVAKRARGEAAHFLLESAESPADLDELAAVLADRWPVRLLAPDRRGAPWSMTLSVTR